MPKGVHYINPEILEKLKYKVAQSIAFPLNTNKNYNLLSSFIFERTGAMLSNSTLRRIFQYESNNHPTKSTLDLICQSIGYYSWDYFSENNKNHSQFDLSQLITMYKLQGLGDHEQTRQILEKFSDHPNFFILLDTVAQVAISNRNTEFLSNLFELKGVFEKKNDQLPIFYFIQTLVIGLNQSGLMPKLIEYYGLNPKAQSHLVEYYVDEDNLNGYYYELLQVYHRHKTTPEALLFYNCLMYQHAIENNLPTSPWIDFLRNFKIGGAIHHIPKARRLAILLLEAVNSAEIEEILNATSDLFHDLSEDDKTDAALYMVKLLFIKQKAELIDKVLQLAPEISPADKPLDDRNNINQIKIYRAYSLFKKGEKAKALIKLNEFDPLLIHAFIYQHIMHDFEIISALINA